MTLEQRHEGERAGVIWAPGGRGFKPGKAARANGLEAGARLVYTWRQCAADTVKVSGERGNDPRHVGSQVIHDVAFCSEVRRHSKVLS